MILSGRCLLFFSLKFAPNLLNGSEILLKSLLDKLLSPINLIEMVCQLTVQVLIFLMCQNFEHLFLNFFYI